MYKILTNNPDERNRVTYPWIFWDNFFVDEEIKTMCDYFSSQGVERGTTVSNEGENVVNESIRVSNLKFYSYDKTNNDTLWMFQKLNGIIEIVNESFYNFDLNGYNYFQYTEYDANESGRYDYHTDTIFGKGLSPDMNETRKLSLTICLNEAGVDYEGGEFQINMSEEYKAATVESKKGRVIAFPSFMLHRIKPVTKGKRKSLVIWVLGPKFR